MHRTKIIGLIIVLFIMISTTCFATSEELKTYEVNKTIPVENLVEYKNSIEKEMIKDNIRYQLQEIQEQENKETIKVDKEQTEKKIVKTSNKYDVLNLFNTKKEVTEDGMSGILELQNDSLDLKINDSYKEQYKVFLTKEYKNISSNELNDIPKVIEKDGTMYYLINPIWTVSKVEKIEGQDVPIEYNGEMQYEGVKERTIIKNYIATVTYKGILEKEIISSVSLNIKYKEIPQEEKTNYIPIVATAGTGVVVVVSGIILWRKKKNKKILK